MASQTEHIACLKLVVNSRLIPLLKVRLNVLAHLLLLVRRPNEGSLLPNLHVGIGIVVMLYEYFKALAVLSFLPIAVPHMVRSAVDVANLTIDDAVEAARPRLVVSSE